MSETTSFKIIAIDGGAASGKSSTARLVAERLNLMHVDTGAHYRTLTCALMNAGADLEDADKLSALLKSLDAGTRVLQRNAYLSINGQLLSDADLRSAAVNASVSRVAALTAVRDFLFNYQRSQADVARSQGNFDGLVMEGRDIGSVIFPNADFRFFLFADDLIRMTRRLQEGQVDSIAERDRRDRERENAPLICPEGAIQIDTGRLNLQEVVDHICETIQHTK